MTSLARSSHTLPNQIHTLEQTRFGHPIGGFKQVASWRHRTEWTRLPGNYDLDWPWSFNEQNRQGRMQWKWNTKRRWHRDKIICQYNCPTWNGILLQAPHLNSPTCNRLTLKIEPYKSHIRRHDSTHRSHTCCFTTPAFHSQSLTFTFTFLYYVWITANVVLDTTKICNN